VKISRRRFLAGVGAAGAAVAADAFGLEANRVLVTRHDVYISGLPPELDRLRIAQITDVHLPGNQLAARAAVQHIHQERPEIVVLNGDLTETARASDQVRDFVGKVRGSLATAAVLGNWEYRAGAVGETARVTYRGTGVDLLVNQTKVVRVGQASLALVGLDDMLHGNPDVLAARRELQSGAVEIWLIHEPALADSLAGATSARPAFLLAGHTHGGQIRIPFLPAFKPIGAGRFLEGWYRETPAPLYVSHGVGTTGIRARFRCPAELPVFTLRRT
jgi:uncharacterized protein